MNDGKATIELYELMLKSLEGTVSRKEFDRLKKLLKEEPSAAKYYVDFMTTYAAMYQPGGACAFVLSPDENGEARFDDIVWRALAETEKVAQEVQIADTEDEEVSTSGDYFGKRRKIIQRRRNVSRLSLYTAIVSTAALLIVMAYVVFNPRVVPVVAALTEVVDVKWVEGSQVPADNMELRPGRMNIARGFAEITFDDGAIVVVQGPAEVELETASQMFLYSGKAWSYVPPGAVGFTIRTPGATIVDYGTEFGVAVRTDGVTETYVFSGRVDLRTGSNPRVFEKAQRLTAGQAGVVDKAGNLTTGAVKAYSFARGMEQIKAGKKLFGQNIVINGDFEADRGVLFNSANQSVPNVKIYGWEDDSEASVLSYIGNIKHEFPNPAEHIVPRNCGRNFFTGVGQCSISQEIDVSLLSPVIDSGHVSYEFSAWLGGFADHPDSAELIVIFLDDQGREINSAKLEQVKAMDRRQETGFIRKKVSSIVPSGTERIRIVLNSYQRIGIADSYVDNISLKLSSN